MFCCIRKKPNKRKQRESESNRNEITETSLIESSKLAELQDKLVRQIAQKNKIINGLESKLTLSDSKLQDANACVSILKEDIKKLEESNNNLVEENNKIGNQYKMKRQTSSPPVTNKVEKLTLEQQCESLTYEVEVKNEKIAKLQTSLNQKTLRLEEVQERQKTLENEINKIEEKNYKISQLTEEIDELKLNLKSRIAEVEQLKNDLFENSYLNNSTKSNDSVAISINR